MTQKREEKREAHLKSFILIVPPSLTTQWLQTITIYKYHEDTRAGRGKTVANQTSIKDMLIKNHSVYAKQVIVIKSYETFSDRHGTAALRKWRTKTLKLTKRTNLPSVPKSQHFHQIQRVDHLLRKLLYTDIYTNLHLLGKMTGTLTRDHMFLQLLQQTVPLT